MAWAKIHAINIQQGMVILPAHRPSSALIHQTRFAPYWWARTAATLHGTCQMCLSKLSGCDKVVCQHCLSDFAYQQSPVKIGFLQAERTLLTYPICYYQYPINQIISQFKDHQKTDCFMILSRLLDTLPKPEHCSRHNTVIIPVPTTARRLRERGFNPVLMLAKYLSKHWQLPIWQGVARADNIAHQRGLSRQARLDNVVGDFYLLQALPVTQVILFDDVATTGATLSAVATLIGRQYPSVKILAVCLAHGSQQLGLERLAKHE